MPIKFGMDMFDMLAHVTGDLRIFESLRDQTEGVRKSKKGQKYSFLVPFQPTLLKLTQLQSPQKLT